MTLVCTGYTERTKPIGEITEQILRRYCGTWTLDLMCIRQFREGIPEDWQKIESISRGLAAGYARVVWLDPSVLITNPQQAPWQNMNSGIVVAKRPLDGKKGEFTLDAGVLVVNCDATPVINCVLSTQNASTDARDLNPVARLHELSGIYRDEFEFVDARELATVHSRSSPIPDRPWMAGDWACHFTGLPVSEMARWAKVIGAEYLSQKTTG